MNRGSVDERAADVGEPVDDAPEHRVRTTPSRAQRAYRSASRAVAVRALVVGSPPRREAASGRSGGCDNGVVGFYRDRVFPRVMNLACNTKETRRIRSEVCAPLAGAVLEIGFGTGLNLPHLPTSVTLLHAVDPLQKGRELASERLAESHVAVDFVGLDGQSLELEDESVDAALSTWTLCTVPDAVAAVREIGRVLRPGGTFHFAEHGRAPDAKVRKWQDRLNRVQQRVACGCNLNRDIAAIIGEGGMTLTSLDMFYAKGDPKILGSTYQGTAQWTNSGADRRSTSP